MVDKYHLINSDDLQVMDGLKMDDLTLSIMSELNLKCIRSQRNRRKDRQKAVRLWRDRVNLREYAIHHMMDGRIGLVPREIHSKVHHKGYFWRIKHNNGDA